MERTRLPNAVIIGAMKCATTALHRYLGAHPEVAMTALKETNFFIGPPRAPHGLEREWWRSGQWHRGLSWYASLFDGRMPVRGESSPGYTSPANPEAATRMAAVIPHARLIYLVRDPLQRALSQYAHHRRDGAEDRPLEDALLDPDSQYLSRSRYFERLQPFLAHFPPQQILVLVQERLLADRRGQLHRVFRHVGVDPHWWDDGLARRCHVGGRVPAAPAALRRAFRARIAADVQCLREFLCDEFVEWGG